jgi:hypothetical protein
MQMGQMPIRVLAAVMLGMVAVLVVTRRTIKAEEELVAMEVVVATVTRPNFLVGTPMAAALEAAAITHLPMELVLAAGQG